MKKIFYLLLICMVSFMACTEEQAKDALEGLEDFYEGNVKPTCETNINKTENQIVGTAIFKAASLEMCNVKIVADFVMSQSPTSASGAPVKLCSQCVMTERFATEKMAMAAWAKFAVADKKLASLSGTTITVNLTSDVEGMDYNAMELFVQQMLDNLKKTMTFEK